VMGGTRKLFEPASGHIIQTKNTAVIGGVFVQTFSIVNATTVPIPLLLPCPNHRPESTPLNPHLP
jgi:hypothetical protein